MALVLDGEGSISGFNIISVDSAFDIGTVKIRDSSGAASFKDSDGNSIAIKSSSINTGGITAGSVTATDLSVGNITTTGYLRGPSTLTIDPSEHDSSTGTLRVRGNLTVDGTTTTINSTTVTTADKNIVIAQGAVDSAAADGAGITVDTVNASLTYSHNDADWKFNRGLEITSGDLHISKLNSKLTLGLTLNNTSGDLGIKSSTPQFTMEPTSDAQSSRIQFSKQDGTLWGSIFGFNTGEQLQYSAATHKFKTASAERMRIDSDGHLFINKNSTSLSTVGHEFGSSGYAYHTRNAASPLYINRTTDDGDIVRLYKDGALVGSIGSRGGGTSYIILKSSSGAGSGLTGSDDTILPMDESALADNNTSLGSASYRFKDLYLSGTLTNNGTGGINIDTSGNVGIGVTPENSSGTWRNLQFGGGNLAFRNSGGNDAMVGTGYLFKTDNSEVYKNTAAVSRLFFDNSTMIFQQAGSGTAGTSISWSDAMRIDASGNVGIGTLSPDQLLDVGDHTAVGNRSIRISQRTGTGNVTYGGLEFYMNNTAGTEVVNAAIKYATGPLRNDGELTFHTGNAGTISERVRIDHNGNLLVGTTSTPLTLISASTGDGIGITGTDGYISISRDFDGAALYLNKTNNAGGQLIQFREDGTNIGSIGIEGGDSLYIQGGTTAGAGLLCHGGAAKILPVRNGASIDATIDLGQDSRRFKDLYLSGGAYLGGTGSANHLDDYEEGTWTPSLSTGSATFTSPKYTKIGRLVFLEVLITAFSDRTTGSAIVVNGLPFTTSSNSRAAGTTLSRYINSGGDQVIAWVGNSRNYMTFYSINQGSDYVNVQHNHLNNSSSNFHVSVVYET